MCCVCLPNIVKSVKNSTNPCPSHTTRDWKGVRVDVEIIVWGIPSLQEARYSQVYQNEQTK